jgi:hypothetical protein
MVVKALGAEWHSDCFCCNVSHFPAYDKVHTDFLRTVEVNSKMDAIFFKRTRKTRSVSSVKKSDSRLRVLVSWIVFLEYKELA